MTVPPSHQPWPVPAFPRSLIRKAVRSAGEVGVRAVLDKTVSKIADYAFDIRHGTDTCRWVYLSELRVSQSEIRHGSYYAPTGVLEFRKLMKELQLPCSGTFVDFGSGKGRVVLMAAAYGFRHVVGVEVSEELCAVAKRNVERYGGRTSKTSSIDIVQCNAATFRIPDDATTLFLFNPFDDTVISRILSDVDESLRRCNRRVYLLYSNAVHADSIGRYPFFTFAGRYSYPRAHFTVYTAGAEPS